MERLLCLFTYLTHDLRDLRFDLVGTFTADDTGFDVEREGGITVKDLDLTALLYLGIAKCFGGSGEYHAH